MVLEGDHVPPQLLRQRRYPFVELGYRLRELLLARGVRGHFELALHFRPRETQRLYLSGLLRVGTLRRLTGLASLLFSFFHALGEAGFRIDESFSGVTHILELSNAQRSMHNAQCTLSRR
jgi:hypothetical protein